MYNQIIKKLLGSGLHIRKWLHPRGKELEHMRQKELDLFGEGGDLVANSNNLMEDTEKVKPRSSQTWPVIEEEMREQLEYKKIGK